MTNNDSQLRSTVRPLRPQPDTAPTQPEANQPDGPKGPTDGTIGERLARLEAAVEGLRHSQNVLLGAVGIGFGLVVAILLAMGSYGITRIDAIPGDLERITTSLSAAITATKQQAPQVLLVPAPAPQLAPKGPKSP